MTKREKIQEQITKLNAQIQDQEIRINTAYKILDQMDEKIIKIKRVL